MKSWKEKMRKSVPSIFIVTSLLIVLSVTVIFAQDLQDAPEPEKVDLLIEEVLDQIEKKLDPATASQELTLEPEISETPALEIDKDIPIEPESFEEAAGMENPDLETAVVEDPFSPEEEVEGAEVELEAITSVEIEEDDEMIKTEETTPETSGSNDDVPLEEPQEALDVKAIPLRHAEASNLVERLKQMKSPDGEVSYNEESRTLILRDTDGKLEEMSAFVKEIDILLETGVFALEYVNVKDIAENIKQILTEDIGQVQFDEESNSVIVTDTPGKIGEIKKRIEALDRFTAEVSIEARTLKIILNDEHLEGVDWEAIVSEYQKLPLSGEGEAPLSLGTISQEDHDILLEALDTVGFVETVFQGNIKTQNETTGMLNVQTSSREEEKVQFYLTPTVKKDGPLQVTVKTQEAGQEAVSVEMESGETIIVGGLFEDVMVASTWKIPLLGDLPLLGFVFRNEGEKSRKTEIIVFLTVKADRNTELEKDPAFPGS
jgi:hypothetical protein